METYTPHWMTSSASSSRLSRYAWSSAWSLSCNHHSFILSKSQHTNPGSCLTLIGSDDVSVTSSICTQWLGFSSEGFLSFLANLLFSWIMEPESCTKLRIWSCGPVQCSSLYLGCDSWAMYVPEWWSSGQYWWHGRSSNQSDPYTGPSAL